MLMLTPSQAATLRPWFLPERPGPLVAAHVLETGPRRLLRRPLAQPARGFLSDWRQLRARRRDHRAQRWRRTRPHNGFVDCPPRSTRCCSKRFHAWPCGIGWCSSSTAKRPRFGCRRRQASRHLDPSTCAPSRRWTPTWPGSTTPGTARPAWPPAVKPGRLCRRAPGFGRLQFLRFRVLRRHRHHHRA